MEKFGRMVAECIQTGTDTIDYTKALTLIEHLQPRKDMYRFVFDTIRDLAYSGSRQDKLNTLALVDFFFKNGLKEFISELQNSPSIHALSGEPVVRDPYVHGVLCELSASWIPVCQSAHCLGPVFIEWQRGLTSFRYRYVLNQAMADKFSADFSATLQLLVVFNEAIVTAFVENLGPDDEMLQQIYPNVNEVHMRLKELKPTIPDPYVTRIIGYLEEYCELCKAQYTSFAKAGILDIDALAEMAGRGIPEQTPVQSQRAVAKPPPAQARPKQGAVVDDLLDFRPPQGGAGKGKGPGKPDPFAGFEFADDLPEDDVSNAEFAAFLGNISTKKK
jgi:hypothetical protein